MVESKKLAQLDPEELKNLVSLRDTREEVLRELGEQKGKQKARQEIAKKMLEFGEPPRKLLPSQAFHSKRSKIYNNNKSI